ncbi:MAG: helix-turn-helix transcriptional regulator [Gemmatimonadota bacterium]
MPPKRYLGEFEQLVLLAILRSGSRANGYAVRRALEEEAGRSVSKGAFYTTLDRLEDKGFLTWELREATEARSRMPQRHFAVTPAGLAELKQTRQTLLRLWSGIEGVLDA